jgi:tRNA-dihydrouridine synthase
MIARGALGNPWIFEDAVSLRNGAEKRTARGAEERARTFIRHALMLEADKGEYVAVREMRKHVAWYFKGLPGVHSLRAKVNTEKSLLSLTSLVSDAFLPRERLR